MDNASALIADAHALLERGSFGRARTLTAGTIADGLQTAAQVFEKLLIKDHSRMKIEATTPFDSTQGQQHRILPVSLSADWDSVSEGFRRGDYLDGCKRAGDSGPTHAVEPTVSHRYHRQQFE